MSEKNLTDREFVKKYESIVEKSEAIKDFGFIIFFIFFFIGINSAKKIVHLFDMLGLNPELIVCFYFIGFILGIGIIIVYQEMWTSRKIQKTLGMTQEIAKRNYYTIKPNEICLKILPLVRQVCMLNPEAKEGQTQMMKGWYGMDPSWIENVYEEQCGNADNLRLAYEYLLEEHLSYRQFFVDKLFKLAVVDDGIHIDEWNLLMDIMKQLKFNKNYFDFFIKRYGPLRTEFEADEQGEKQSTENIPVSQLKAYFAILGLEEGASDQEIKRAYHNLALQHHPDLPKNADRVEECETMMARINEAYEKIRN